MRRRLQEGNYPDLLWVEPTYSEKGQLVPASKALEAGVSRKAPPQLRLEQVRAVSQFLGRRPVEAERCLVVIEAVEAMAEGAANALLKTLEEPGDGLLILFTAAPDRLLSTIRSRCQAIPFARLAPEQLQQVLVPIRRPILFIWDLQVEVSGKQPMQEAIGKIFLMVFLGVPLVRLLWHLLMNLLFMLVKEKTPCVEM